MLPSFVSFSHLPPKDVNIKFDCDTDETDKLYNETKANKNCGHVIKALNNSYVIEKSDGNLSLKLVANKPGSGRVLISHVENKDEIEYV